MSVFLGNFPFITTIDESLPEHYRITVRSRRLSTINGGCHTSCVSTPDGHHQVTITLDPNQNIGIETRAAIADALERFPDAKLDLPHSNHAPAPVGPRVPDSPSIPEFHDQPVEQRMFEFMNRASAFAAGVSGDRARAADPAPWKHQGNAETVGDLVLASDASFINDHADRSQRLWTASCAAVSTDGSAWHRLVECRSSGEAEFHAAILALENVAFGHPKIMYVTDNMTVHMAITGHQMPRKPRLAELADELLDPVDELFHERTDVECLHRKAHAGQPLTTLTDALAKHGYTRAICAKEGARRLTAIADFWGEFLHRQRPDLNDLSLHKTWVRLRWSQLWEQPTIASRTWHRRFEQLLRDQGPIPLHTSIAASATISARFLKMLSPAA